MLQHREVNGKAYLLDFVSIADIKALDIPADAKQASIHQAMSGGGFTAGMILKETVGEVNRLIGSDLDTNVDYPIITVITDVSNLMKPENVEALIKHEEGHILHEHVNRSLMETERPDAEKHNLLINQDMELAADAYALTHVSNDVLREALYAVASVMAYIVSMKTTTELGNEVFEDIINHPIMKVRLAALQ